MAWIKFGIRYIISRICFSFLMDAVQYLLVCVVSVIQTVLERRRPTSTFHVVFVLCSHRAIVKLPTTSNLILPKVAMHSAEMTCLLGRADSNVWELFFLQSLFLHSDSLQCSCASASRTAFLSRSHPGACRDHWLAYLWMSDCSPEMR